MDIQHPALASRIWINEDEIPGNGIDDDQNGYVDDIHGWNFLGESQNETLNTFVFKNERIRIPMPLPCLKKTKQRITKTPSWLGQLIC